MNKAKSLVGKIKKRLFPQPYPIFLKPHNIRNKEKGRLPYSYLEEPLLWHDHSSKLRGHSNNWESRTISRIFQELGYSIEAINWKDKDFKPNGYYDVVFDIFENLGRWAPYIDTKTIKLLHLTGSDPFYQNNAEIQRIRDVNQRRNGNYKPKRFIENPELTHKSLEAADACSLIGNEHTLRTYPDKFWRKINLVTVSASYIGSSAKEIDKFVPPEREFLWFFGYGAVHKGLDLVLEVFSRQRNLKLNIVGNVESEIDFMEMYRKELTQFDNIKYYGPLIPSSLEFKKIISRVFCFIAPTCSESISTAVATCLQLGLYPIISRDTGITLPESCGFYLDSCSIDEIENHIIAVHNMAQSELVDQIRQLQNDALLKYSRKAFQIGMAQYISDVFSI